MARFYGAIGFSIGQVEAEPGVWVENIIESEYYGDVLRPARQLEGGDKVNDDLRVNHTISVVADAFASENFFAIRYLKWAGVLWEVPDVQIQSPRLLLRLGGVYNGPTPIPPVPEGPVGE